MKESFWGYMIIALGVMIILFMLFVQNLTTKSEEDFYLVREVLEASMYDSIDYGTYAKSGKLVMSEEKFVEIFIRRFAENVANNQKYKIDFYDIHEYPPKATVVVTTSTGRGTVGSDDVNINVNTYLNAILESNVTQTKEVKTCGVGKGDLANYVVPYIEDEEGYIHTANKLPNNTKLVLKYKFLAENDPCGYYKYPEAYNKEKFTKNRNTNLVDLTKEYCYLNKPETKEFYFVRKDEIFEYMVDSNKEINCSDYREIKKGSK